MDRLAQMGPGYAVFDSAGQFVGAVGDVADGGFQLRRPQHAPLWLTVEAIDRVGAQDVYLTCASEEWARYLWESRNEG